MISSGAGNGKSLLYNHLLTNLATLNEVIVCNFPLENTGMRSHTHTVNLCPNGFMRTYSPSRGYGTSVLDMKLHVPDHMKYIVAVDPVNLITSNCSDNTTTADELQSIMTELMSFKQEPNCVGIVLTSHCARAEWKDQTIEPLVPVPDAELVHWCDLVLTSKVTRDEVNPYMTVNAIKSRISDLPISPLYFVISNTRELVQVPNSLITR
jgi:hypothetical protein